MDGRVRELLFCTPVLPQPRARIVDQCWWRGGWGQLGGCRYGHGFQHPSFPPSAWSHVGLVLAHPVPLFTWDILEAFPSARVVLTVRDAEVGGWMCWGDLRAALIQM